MYKIKLRWSGKFPNANKHFKIEEFFGIFKNLKRRFNLEHPCYKTTVEFGYN